MDGWEWGEQVCGVVCDPKGDRQQRERRGGVSVVVGEMREREGKERKEGEEKDAGSPGGRL